LEEVAHFAVMDSRPETFPPLGVATDVLFKDTPSPLRLKRRQRSTTSDGDVLHASSLAVKVDDAQRAGCVLRDTRGKRIDSSITDDPNAPSS